MSTYDHLSLPCFSLLFNKKDQTLFLNNKQVGSSNEHFLHIKLAFETLLEEFYKDNTFSLIHKISEQNITESPYSNVSDKISYTDKHVYINFAIFHESPTKSLQIKINHDGTFLSKKELRFVVKWINLYFKNNNIYVSTASKFEHDSEIEKMLGIRTKARDSYAS